MQSTRRTLSKHVVPHAWLQPTTAREADGKEVELPRFERHMLCDEDSLFPEGFNSSWEGKVVLAELQRDRNVAWYRNPARASQDSLGVIYEDGDETKIVRPDFVFFGRLPDGSIAADIIDPHGTHLSDALPRLRGLARYAEAHEKVFRRIEVLAEVAGAYRVLDLTEPSVRGAIQNAQSARALYQSDAAREYDLGGIS